MRMTESLQIFSGKSRLLSVVQLPKENNCNTRLEQFSKNGNALTITVQTNGLVHTWTSLKKYKEGIEAEFKNRKDRMYQKCEHCHRENPNKHEARHTTLEKKKGPRSHARHQKSLCVKCISGSICDA
ncbi:15385_t:CDS:2 [Funneliformis geosporum]|uniref:15385_t:CDS:1 n=1 Tax=Funneliformis geosporum TaxID=1117311 RepID=A0A9W4SRP1_9GLOM|nr:15385_t:CDS:2 [Funneliformis geosporum]